jgi:hypothetical protein
MLVASVVLVVVPDSTLPKHPIVVELDTFDEGDIKNQYIAPFFPNHQSAWVREAAPLEVALRIPILQWI